MSKYRNGTFKCIKCPRYLSETEAQYSNRCTDCLHQEATIDELREHEQEEMKRLGLDKYNY